LLTASGASTGSQWFNAGSTASFATPGVFGRSSGAGSRVASYTVDGGPANMVTPAAGNITVSLLMNAPHMLAFTSVMQYQVSPESVTTKVVTQYQLSTPTGSVASVTAPSITGDNGWYDSGTAVTATFNSVFNEVAMKSRLVAVGYSVDGGTVIVVAEGGPATF